MEVSTNYMQVVASDNNLYVIVPIFNPEGYKSRYSLYNDFIKKLITYNGISIYTIELVIGDQDYNIPYNNFGENIIRLHTNQKLWYKENLINIAIQSLPSTAKYVAWVDADIEFLNKNWVYDTISALEKYHFVQMFSEYIDLDDRYNITNRTPSYIKMWQNSDQIYRGDCYNSKFIGATGLAWAGRIDTIKKIGYLPDYEIVGSGDWVLSYMLTGKAKSLHKDWHTKGHEAIIKYYASAIDKYVNMNVGYINGTIVHNWHGAKSNRGYNWRWNILKNHRFDPTIDIYRDSYGLLHMRPNKEAILTDLASYFQSRDEDALNA